MVSTSQTSSCLSMPFGGPCQRGNKRVAGSGKANAGEKPQGSRNRPALQRGRTSQRAVLASGILTIEASERGFTGLAKHYQHVRSTGGDYLGVRIALAGVLRATGGGGVTVTRVPTRNAERAGTAGADRAGRTDGADRNVAHADTTGDAAGPADSPGTVVFPCGGGAADCLQPDAGSFLVRAPGGFPRRLVFRARAALDARRNYCRDAGTARRVAARGIGNTLRFQRRRFTQ